MPVSKGLQARRRRAKDDGRGNRGDAISQPSEERPSGERTARGRSSNRSGGNADHHASTCRWAIPTLFLPAPYWWDAEDRPWGCLRAGAPRVLKTTEDCADCPYWELRPPAQPTAPVSTVDAIRQALESTYRARATCRKVMEAFGPVRPFVEIRQDEERHARALRALFDRLGIEPPPDTWRARVVAPVTLVEACAAASRAELERAAMYERLIPFVGDPSARRTLRRIQAASSRRYLPAFRRCFVRALKPTGRPRGVRAGRSAP